MNGTDNTFANLARSLTEKARRLALARGEMRLRTLRRDSSRWREARLLWPHFTGRTR